MDVEDSPKIISDHVLALCGVIQYEYRLEGRLPIHQSPQENECHVKDLERRASSLSSFHLAPSGVQSLETLLPDRRAKREHVLIFL